jgi:hypothetical protein
MRAANASANIPPQLVARILEFYRYKDVIENRIRQSHELVIDHRFPMERWGISEPSHDVNMSVAEMRNKFQLLKKDSAGNHNLLKSSEEHQWISDFGIPVERTGRKIFLNLEQKQNMAV